MSGKIFDHVMRCPICDGKGEHEQVYNAGCGRGYYKTTGPCSMCDKFGWIYRSTYRPVTSSVYSQIQEALNREDLQKMR